MSFDPLPTSQEAHSLSDWELWACAQHQIDQHGEEAATVAAMRADRFLDAGDIRGHQVWLDIMNRIRQLTQVALDDTRH